MEQQLDIVLPTKAVGDHGRDLHRVINGVIPSLRFHGYEGTVRKFFIVCPGEDYPEIHSALAATRADFDFQFVFDADAAKRMGFSVEEFRRVPGWYKQQLLKLEATSHSQAYATLILDSDIIALRNIANLDFATRPWPYHAGGLPQGGGWYKGSAEVLGFSWSDLDPEGLRMAMGVTPEFLDPIIVRALLNYIKLRAGTPAWGPYLFSFFTDYVNSWTEFSLYWLFVLQIENRVNLYRPSKLYRFLDRETDINAFDFQSSSELFAVIQGGTISTNIALPLYERLRSEIWDAAPG